MNTRLIIPALVTAACAFGGYSSVANAGGLCGKGGPIRGSVGEACDKRVEKPITTPMAQNTVVQGGRAVGGAVGGYIGGPTGAALGQEAGGYVGRTINERAANKSPPIGRPYRAQQQSNPYVGGGSPPSDPYGAYASSQPAYAPPYAGGGGPPQYGAS